MITLNVLRSRYPFVFFREPIDRMGQILSFVYCTDDSPIANENFAYGQVNLMQEPAEVIADVRAIVGAKHHRESGFGGESMPSL